MNKTTASRLKKTTTYEVQEKLLLEWRENWYNDQCKVIQSLKQAAMRDDYDEVIHIAAILKGMTEKRFGTLENMIHIVCDKNRVLHSKEDETFEESVADINTGDIDDARKNIEDTKKELTLNTYRNDSEDSSPEYDNIESHDKKSKIKKAVKFNVDEMLSLYRSGMSVTNLSEYYGFSEGKIVKLLVTYNVYSTDLYDDIKNMRESGKSDEEIRIILGLSKNAYNKYIPYQKLPYNLDEEYISDNAKNLRALREKWKSKR